MTPSQFQAWIDHHCNGNKAMASREIGITRHTVDNLLSGVAPKSGKAREIPRYIELACEALSNRRNATTTP